MAAWRGNGHKKRPPFLGTCLLVDIETIDNLLNFPFVVNRGSPRFGILRQETLFRLFRGFPPTVKPLIGINRISGFSAGQRPTVFQLSVRFGHCLFLGFPLFCLSPIVGVCRRLEGKISGVDMRPTPRLSLLGFPRLSTFQDYLASETPGRSETPNSALARAMKLPLLSVKPRNTAFPTIGEQWQTDSTNSLASKPRNPMMRSPPLSRITMICDIWTLCVFGLP